jgi:hypothetical protein
MGNTDKQNANKFGKNSDNKKTSVTNTAKNDINTLKPKSYGTVRMVSSRTYKSNTEESDER